MAARVAYRLDDSIATITMDDGKANVISPSMLAELGDALDQAASDQAVVVLTGRSRMFSGGFDLGVLAAGGDESTAMVRGGFELAARILAFPRPVVVACTGHAMAMGAFLLLSGDYRVGAAGPYKISANEVAIGITMPMAGVEICRQRLAPAHFNRAVLTAEIYGPDSAVDAGFLDQVVPEAELADTARTVASRFTLLDPKAHAESKLRVREQSINAIRAAVGGAVVELEAAVRPATTADGS
jgi:enoyl-CoA hydratase